MRLIVLLVLFGLTACSGSAAPTPTRTGSSTAAVTTSHSATLTAPRTGPLTTGPNVRPGEKPPELPADAAEHNVSGALAFAIFYFAAVDWSFATNDASLVRNISKPSCQACSRLARRFDDLASGQVFKGGRVRLISAGIASGNFAIRTDWVVRVKIHQDAGVLTGGSKAESQLKASDVESLVFVSWTGAGWQVVEVGAPA